MDERIARDVVLVRAIETADQKREILSDDDRMFASRSAKELAQWEAADRNAPADIEHFLRHRSEQVLKRIGQRVPAFATFARRSAPLSALHAALPVIALVAGAAIDRIADPHRVDLLSPPLLLIVVWNLLVYAGLLAWLFLPTRMKKRWTERNPLRGLSGRRQALPRRLPGALSNALFTFTTEWTQLSARLNGTRLARTMHLSAALFALGAMLSLYARGVWSEYAAGWESTFLDAGGVHALLSLLFTPAVALFHLQGFSVADIEALHFSRGAVAGSGAKWVHLYAATLVLMVVVPRFLLAAVSHWRASRVAKRFPLDLHQPYFRKLSGAIGGAPGVLRVLPYSYTLDEARDKGLAAVAAMLLGDQARVMLRPPSAYGDEPSDALGGTPLDDKEVTLTVVLFSLAATPEKENHGAFLDHLARASKRPVLVLVDESGYLERIGMQAGGAARVGERIALWQRFCKEHQASASVVNLLTPETRPLDESVPFASTGGA